MNRRVGPGVARPSAEGGSISSLLEPHRHLDAPTRRSGLAKAVSLRARPVGEREIVEASVGRGDSFLRVSARPHARLGVTERAPWLTRLRPHWAT